MGKGMTSPITSPGSTGLLQQWELVLTGKFKYFLNKVHTKIFHLKIPVLQATSYKLYSLLKNLTTTVTTIIILQSAEIGSLYTTEQINGLQQQHYF